MTNPNEQQQSDVDVQAMEIRLLEQAKKIRELESLALTDSVTGLLNRRGFEAFFEREQSRMSRSRSPGSVLILFDIDGFKEINDTYGHQAGNACLKRAGEYLKSRIRHVDAAARIGGNEFAVLLSDVDVEKARECLSEVRESMNGLHAYWMKQKIRFSASMGFCQVTKLSTYETAYRVADNRLCDNKRERKDELCAFFPGAGQLELANA